MTDQTKLERQRAASKRYYWRHKKQEAARMKRWHEAHPGYRTKKTREFRLKNPEYWQVWAISHRENLRAADERHRQKKRGDLHP